MPPRQRLKPKIKQAGHHFPALAFTLGGKFKGVTPFTIELPIGSYSVAYRKEGFKPLEGLSLVIQADQEVKLTKRNGKSVS